MTSYEFEVAAKNAVECTCGEVGYIIETGEVVV